MLSRSYFQGAWLILRTCTGDSVGQKATHMQLTPRPKPKTLFTLKSSSAEIFNGDVSNYFKSLLHISSSPITPGKCWKCIDGNHYCNGRCQRHELYYSIPVVLIFDLDGSEEEHENEWTFPKTIKPMDSKAEKSNGVAYDLVGKILFDSSTTHFTTRFVSGKKAVYIYNDMENGGCAVLDPKLTVAKDLVGVAGGAVGQTGVQTTAVFYYLRGGINAQDYFRREQMRRIQEVFPQIGFRVEDGHDMESPYIISSSELQMTPDEDRFWLKDPSDMSSIDYAQVVACPTTPRKRPKKAAAPSKSNKISKKTKQDYPSRVQNGRLNSDDELEDSQQPLAEQTRKPPLSHNARKRKRHLVESKYSGGSSDSAIEDARIPRTSKPTSQPSSITAVTAQVDVAPQQSEQVHVSSSQGNHSVFSLNCRCGAVGDGYNPDENDGLDAIQCPICEEWSHIACQKNGRASRLHKNARFYCDSCLPAQQRTKSRKRSKSDKHAASGLSQTQRTTRLAKRAASKQVQYDRQAYLLKQTRKRRAVSTWKVLVSSAPTAEELAYPDVQEVRETDLVDELWNEREKRRSVRLGKWQLTFEMESPGDELINYQSPTYAYTEEIDAALRPYRALLQLLLHFSFEGPDESSLPDDLLVPSVDVVKKRIEERRNGAQVHRALQFAEQMILEYGDISLKRHAQILNWIHNEMPGAKDGVMWWHHVVDAHAVTIFIAATKRDLFEQDADFPRTGTHIEQRNFLWKKAWEYQCEHNMALEPPGVDVDRECIRLFEDRLFENSKESGMAGNEQWGLDVGSLQGGFYPYHQNESWDKKDYEESESEFIRGPDYREASDSEKEPERLTSTVSVNGRQRRVKGASRCVKSTVPQTTLALARCGFGESLFEAFTRLGVEDFRNFVTVWRANLRIQLRTNSQGFLRGRRPLLTDKIPDNFPSREVIDLYINPVTSWSTTTLASIPVHALWRPRSPTIPAVALACMKNLGWDFGTLIKNFTKLWPGMFLQMIYSPLAIYDRSRRLLATPTTQAVILMTRSKPRMGQYALKYGDNHLVQISFKLTNFVALVASLFDGIGTIVPVKEHTTVWLPFGYSIREGLFPAGFLPGVPTLGPGVLQLTTGGGSNSNEAQASASSRRKGGTERRNSCDLSGDPPARCW
ncbi:hypothetical protein D9613_012157 [Agrocybe pediades]|uniref:PHD-type domain-containing protein n=1 Tax=Agrocybe pediades TaxID=84607 RepID=A0A8H4R2N3_9AGAR|nr:hypothetical protein D9613_012157 [Agrocybe pediades]